jgi:PhnB protein
MTTTAQAQTDTRVTQLAPYIFFYGRCEEALKFYAEIFRGTFDLQRVGDGPMAEHAPADFQDKVMHARFTAPGLTFMAGDGRESKPIDPDAGNITLALEAPDRAEGERIFTALSSGGDVKMPLADAFWGGQFGMLVDRFGNEWMVTAP